jgi:hypothetical protein
MDRFEGHNLNRYGFKGPSNNRARGKRASREVHAIHGMQDERLERGKWRRSSTEPEPRTYLEVTVGAPVLSAFVEVQEVKPPHFKTPGELMDLANIIKTVRKSQKAAEQPEQVR